MEGLLTRFLYGCTFLYSAYLYYHFRDSDSESVIKLHFGDTWQWTSLYHRNSNWHSVAQTYKVTTCENLSYKWQLVIFWHKIFVLQQSCDIILKLDVWPRVNIYSTSVYVLLHFEPMTMTPRSSFSYIYGKWSNIRPGRLLDFFSY